MGLTPAMLLLGYRQGIFPMDRDGEIYWYDPNPRAILPLDAFHVPQSLRRRVKSGRFEVRTDTAFTDVMRACSLPAPGREHTWISEEFIATYSQLQTMGYAHSVESWLDGELVGGLYGVAVGGLFAGESMFHTVTDASKVALFALVERLRRGGFVLLDVQFMTNHLRRFGVVEISRMEYKRRLAEALLVTGQWGTE